MRRGKVNITHAMSRQGSRKKNNGQMAFFVARIWNSSFSNSAMTILSILPSREILVSYTHWYIETLIQ